MAKKQKFYVVWSGRTPGIYTSWADCEAQVKGAKGAVYKAFDTREEAEQAFASAPDKFIVKMQKCKNAKMQEGKNAKMQKDRETVRPRDPEELPIYPEEVVPNALAVDAACSGNPGMMEYRGVYVGNRQQIFHFGPMFGTNNIGEFLAIVHGLALIQQKGWDLPIYSDSRNAMLWVKAKKCRTKLERNARTEPLFQLIERAEKWLREHTYTTPIMKWQTDKWGEIPADFGRK
ncbi:MAG: ribonuclease H family protein [Bacteroidaceae bacterium]|nr:ribonuclease H family protein [Bacteroidaceae bacterium]